MWPKAIAQLIELLPHVARLLPMADRFLNAKTTAAEASRNAMEQMAEGLRGDLGQVTASHAGLYRQLNDQSAQLSALSIDLRSTQQSVEAMNARLARIESAQKQQRILVLITLILVVVVFVILVVRKH